MTPRLTLYRTEGVKDNASKGSSHHNGKLAPATISAPPASGLSGSARVTQVHQATGAAVPINPQIANRTAAIATHSFNSAMANADVPLEIRPKADWSPEPEHEQKLYAFGA
jgi:hypothetical protein